MNTGMFGDWYPVDVGVWVRHLENGEIECVCASLPPVQNNEKLMK